MLGKKDLMNASDGKVNAGEKLRLIQEHHSMPGLGDSESPILIPSIERPYENRQFLSGERQSSAPDFALLLTA
jgi:hypothetical protein